MQNKKSYLTTGFLFWWGGADSNHRSKMQQIYSLSPLATREPPHKLVMGLEPATC